MMRQKAIPYTLLLWLLASISVQAQVTHALSYQLGISNVYYHSQNNRPSYWSHFIPPSAFDYYKYSDNVFWGGAGIGIIPRYVTLYKPDVNTRYGIRYPEFWLRARAGLKAEREFLTHLPFLSLGITYNKIHSSYSQTRDGGSVILYANADTTMRLIPVTPFIEVGNTMINSTFRSDKFNVFITIGARYYPLNMFDANSYLLVGIDEPIKIQYRIAEIYINAGFQLNFHK